MPEFLYDFQRTQAAFAAYIRDPEGVIPPSDVSCQRMAAYRDLFFNNIENFIATAFPVSKSVLGVEAWRSLSRDFYRGHHCKTPLFIEIAEEFLEYLSNERSEELVDPPFLLELAHYEWVELALAVSEEELPEAGNASGRSILDDCISVAGESHVCQTAESLLWVCGCLGLIHESVYNPTHKINGFNFT